MSLARAAISGPSNTDTRAISCEHHHTVVALGFTLGICIPFSDITGACFEIHLGGQAITQINFATKLIRCVLVPLDKARGNDVTTGVDGFFTA